jgi:hypothetical protein
VIILVDVVGGGKVGGGKVGGGKVGGGKVGGKVGCRVVVGLVVCLLFVF